MLTQLVYDAGDAAATGADLVGLTSNLPTNANTTILGGATGPVNKDNLSLAAAGIAAGTSVQITVNMNGEVPHLIAVMGGSAPTVTYDAAGNGGNGALTLTSTTTGNSLTNAAGDVFSSTFGFMILTQDVIGTSTTPLGVIAQTDHWVGDIFPLLPGFDSAAEINGGGGDVGTTTARCGTTIYGQTGETRSINLFMSDAAATILFGTAMATGDLGGFVGNTEQSETVSDATNMGLAGKQVSFNYTFASPKDVTFGGTGTTTGSSGGGGGGGGGGSLAPLTMLFAGLPLLLYARKRKNK